MPHKGFYTQGIAVLLDREAALDGVTDCLRDYRVTMRPQGTEEWAFGGPTVLIPYRPEVNGFVSVDVVNHPWPDHMGDPKAEPMLFGAWAMGYFGPGAFPGNLERAALQSWHWPEGKSVPQRHRAFVRVRSSYVFGNIEDEAPVMPKDYAPLDELLFVIRIGRALLSLPGAICYFNPNGETLQTAHDIDRLFDRQEATGLRPLELWSNVRVLRLDEHDAWLVMDTVGMSQLDVPDHEAAFQRDRYDLSEVANFLRNAADYVFANGPIIRDGDTMDGPGGIRWQGATFDKPTCDPPREVIRWLALDHSSPPQHLLGQYAKGEACRSQEDTH